MIKNTLTLIISLFALSTFAQHSILWSDEVIVSDGTQYGVLRPRMALTTNDYPVIVYGKTNGQIYSSRWNGVDFDTPVTLLPSGMSAYVAYWTGPDIAAKGDTVIIVFKANPLESGNVYSVRSTDGGVTFSDTIRVDNHDVGVAWMPSLDITADGNPVVTYMAHDAIWNNPRYVIANSSDGGVSYNPEMTVVSSIPGEACDCCPAEVVIDGDKQMMLFRNNNANVRDIYGVLSTNAGTSFDYEENVDNMGWVINACPSTGPHGTFTGNGEFITVFASGAGGPYRNYLSKSDASSSLNFISLDTIPKQTGNSTQQNFPRIHGLNDTIVMAWQERLGTSWEIFASVSTNQMGDHIAELKSFGIQVNDSATGTQENPDVRYSNGKIHVCYSNSYAEQLMYRSGEIDELNINESEIEEVSVYPNPGEGKYTIGLKNQPTAISVINALGESIEFEYTLEGKTLNLSIEPSVSGIYLLTISYQNGSRTNTKLLVK